MSDLFHECGVAAVYHLPGQPLSPLALRQSAEATSRHIPRLLLEIQNRGQLAAGMSVFHPDQDALLHTYKDVGTVSEVFHLNHQDEYDRLMSGLQGAAAIGHVRYATCGRDDRSYAQPFERPHLEKSKWFTFGFNGQLANFKELRDEILSQGDFHLSRDNDTEVLMHLIAQQLRGDQRPTIEELLTNLSRRLDGAYNIVYLNAQGEMFCARDPLGIRPLCYAFDGSLFAAASESVALANIGFSSDQIQSLAPGEAILVRDGRVEVKRFAESHRTAHCFFEWIYFANVASTLDEQSVYLTRKRLGAELAKLEMADTVLSLTTDKDTIVVPVPDTAKAAADAMAFELGIPCVEGLIRNRYLGRTFIEGGAGRADKVRMKYTPLPEVLRGKRVLLVEDTIVRSTTMKGLIHQLKERGGAREVHVRVACPPIIAPCFYGIDMSTEKELFAAEFLKNAEFSPELERQMAVALKADSLKYLPLPAIARSVGIPAESLCQACLTGRYPTDAGTRLYQLAINEQLKPPGRTYESALVAAATTR
jgi:amidophosphoribosyltransferase